MKDYNKLFSKQITLVLAIAIIIIFSGWLFLRNTSVNHNQNISVATSTNLVSSPTITSAGTVSNKTSTIPGTSIQYISTKPVRVSAPVPNLDRPFPDTSKLDSVFVSRIKSEISDTVANLKKDKTSFNDWIDIGIERKSIGDYVGASEAWEYVSLMYPSNIISFSNLGDLYANFLKDYSKAEARYKKAIANSPTTIDLYRNLYNVFLAEGKNTEAVAILQQGLAKNPKSFDLTLLLARYYRDAGDKSSAVNYYNQAISIANMAGDSAMVQSLQTEERNM